ncbi:metallophosphoesterase family protein [Nocardia ignorata]|uniref:metallophosphoesterase family protein n=1 Tax=Nocardia ignorata TaxID=145285 RepID=UPI00105F9BAE|nr:metallophosphoesterase [Nocardia ignorata]
MGNKAPVRIAATADLHMRPAVAGKFRSDLLELGNKADLLLLAGDLTDGGTVAEAELLCAELAGLAVPIVAVLGNHDHDAGAVDVIAGMLTGIGVRVLDGGATVCTVRGHRIGIAGVMGGSGGFPAYPGDPDSGSEEHRTLMRRGAVDALRLRAALEALDTPTRIALTHFSPTVDTLAGEPISIYPGLGCQALGDAIDAAGATLALHGHAHAGTEDGRTTGNIAVHNVSYPVLRRTYALYDLATTAASG